MTLLTGQPTSPDTRDELITYAETHGLANLSRLLFNMSEVIFVD
ncbi:MAG: hypothetical protein R3B91_05385 [Planctomycetaceae bacterium]